MTVKAKLVQGGDGTAIPAGMVGEVRVFTSRTTTGSSGAYVVNSSELIDLPSGRWSIKARATFSKNNTANVVYAFVSTNSTVDASGGIAGVVDAYNQVSNAALGATLPMFEFQVLDVSTTQKLYAKSYSEDAAVNVTIEGFAIRIA